MVGPTIYVREGEYIFMMSREYLIIFPKKYCISYFLASAIISKFNIFPNKQTFHIHLTIIKIKKSSKNNIYLLNLKK